MNKNFKIKVTGNWCEYQPAKFIDLGEIISFECWTDQIGNPYRFYLKNGDYHRIDRYEIGKQIEDALKAKQTELGEYRDVTENLDEMYVREIRKSNELQKLVEDFQYRIGSACYTLEELSERLMDSSEAQDLCDLAYLTLSGDQASKDDPYEAHRQKAEEAIANGASLTKHKVDL